MKDNNGDKEQINKLVVVFSGAACVYIYGTLANCLETLQTLRKILERRNSKQPYESLFHVHALCGQTHVIDTSSIVAIYLAPVGLDYQKLYLENQEEMKRPLEKHLGEGDEWKDGLTGTTNDN